MVVIVLTIGILSCFCELETFLMALKTKAYLSISVLAVSYIRLYNEEHKALPSIRIGSAPEMTVD